MARTRNTPRLTAEQARELLRYEPSTGKLYWLPRPREMFATDYNFASWHTQFAGSEALISYTIDGYRCGKILGHSYSAHRLIWLIQTGEWPDQCIDHVNGVRDDNRWPNLRAASVAENNWNKSRQSNNTSGVNGVSWHSRDRKWQATIVIDGRRKHLGQFDTLEAAAAARMAANIEFGFTERHGKALAA